MNLKKLDYNLIVSIIICFFAIMSTYAIIFLKKDEWVFGYYNYESIIFLLISILLTCVYNIFKKNNINKIEVDK